MERPFQVLPPSIDFETAAVTGRRLAELGWTGGVVVGGGACWTRRGRRRTAGTGGGVG